VTEVSDEVDGRVAQMIQAAVLAGAYAETIRRVPETAAGFGKLMRRHLARVAALADEIALSVGQEAPVAAPRVLRLR
jgi:hypothetical protein